MLQRYYYYYFEYGINIFILSADPLPYTSRFHFDGYMDFYILTIFQCDVFELNAVDLDDLVKVKVVHDGAGPGSGWYLDKIIAKTSENGDTRYVFNCGK